MYRRKDIATAVCLYVVTCLMTSAITIWLEAKTIFPIVEQLPNTI
jgi:hypothetical protein